MTARDLFPQADASDPATQARFRRRLKDEEEALADYRKNRGKPGHWYRRGFVRDTQETIRRIKLWLDFVAARQY